MIPLQAISIGFVVAVGTTVVLVRDPLRQVMTNGVYAFALVLLFLVFQAPDVALSMLVVGVVAFPLVFLAAINRMRATARQAEEGEEE
ncbi:MAG: Na(+)/H(+) antiporter subunit B [Gaiellaceae bacterium]